MVTPQQIERAIGNVRDQRTFIQELLVNTLQWPVPEGAQQIEDITYEWSKEDLRAAGLERKVMDGQIRQLVLPGCPWGIFIVEFTRPDVFITARGMTGPLRQILAGLVPRQRKAAHLPSFFRQHLLFICTHKYQHFRFVHFKDPGEAFKTPPLASFGWWPGDSTKTVSTYNLPNLAYLGEDSTVDEWLEEWASAFDVDRVTKRFYEDYKEIHARFQDGLTVLPEAGDRAWLASVLLNRLMFVYFLQKKGFLDGGNTSYLEDKLAAGKGRDRFHTDFLNLLFFEGFAKPNEQRSNEAKAKLGNIRYLNGGLFLEHPIEQKTRHAEKIIALPDSLFAELFKLFASFSWNLNDRPGGQDNEINPDVLGYIVEKYINQKAFGAYYTRPEITSYLCERTIHRLILDAVNTPPESSAKLGIPIRDFKSIAELLQKLDNPLATKLLDDVLPNLSLLDPACGSGAFLVAAMKTLIDIYAAIFGWVEFNGSSELKGRLKTIRKDHPSLDYFIKKRIITDNLYGVDIMEEAVEIARLRLFLALAASASTVQELEPLPNIDFNILRGNSLIGLMHVDPNGFNQKNLFLPPYDHVLRDRDRQLDTYRHTAGYTDNLAAMRDKIAEVNSAAQATLDDMLLADFASLGIKFEEATWDDEKAAEGKPKKRALKLDDIQALHPFHWAFAFDKVMARGGFDGIITNPPWEIFKPNGKEFFEQHSEMVTKKSMSLHDFLAEQSKLLRGLEIRRAWLRYLSSYEHQNQFFRSAPEYRNQIGTVNGKRVGSDLNLYKLFLERCFRLLREGGRCGIVIPSGIYTDLGAKQLRMMLFQESTIDALFCFENRRGIFEDVHKMFKFVVLTFARSGQTTEFPAAFMRHDVQELERFPQEGSLTISLDLVRKLSPDSLSIMEFKLGIDVQIARKMLRFPLVGETVPNRWQLVLYREFHMTDDSDLFETQQANGRLPLYEGKMIWQFDNQLSPPRFWVNEARARERLIGPASDDSGQLLDYQFYRLGFRDIAANTNERTLICTVIPKTFHGNKIPCARILNGRERLISDREQVFVSALWNSFSVDWMVRQKVTTTLNYFYLYQLPVPRLTDGDARFGPLVQHAARLICTTSEFDDLAKSVGLIPPDHRAGVTDPAGRARLRAELDAMVAHLYGLTEEEFEHILSTFPLVEAGVKQAALSEFKRMLATGEAAIFNPDLAKPAAAQADPAEAVRDLIAAGESATVEFKSSARWDVKQNQPGKHIERIIVKTVAAFLNTSGGTMVIGVEDNGNIFGLAEDYRLCGKNNRDGFELWLMQTLLKDFGKDAAGQLSLAFHELKKSDPARPGGGDVCVVTVKPSPRPRFVVENGQEFFFIRTGNATHQLTPSELLKYCAQRWPEAMSVA